MNSKATLVAACVIAIGLIALEAFVVLRDHSNERWFDAKDLATTSMVDKLEFVDTRETFRQGKLRAAILASDDDGPIRVVLDGKTHNGFPREGTWTSPIVQTDFPFTELVPSWNLITPDKTGVLFDVRARDAAGGEWSPWLRIGAWGRTTASDRRDEFDWGRVKIDTLLLDRSATAYQIRATLQSYDLDVQVTPAIRRIAVVYSGPVDQNSIWARRIDPGPVEGWARTLDVPYLPQGDNAKAITGMTCSPTSTTMVLQYWGVSRSAMENCLAIWDDHHDLFGNWSNATQRCAELGMDAWLERFRNWNQVKAKIAAGQPVIASIEYEKGTFAETPDLAKRESGGHLLVIRGFTPRGDVIVNDPAYRDTGNGQVLSARGLAHAWFGHGGVGYVIRPPAKPLPASMIAKSPATQPAGATTAPVARGGGGGDADPE